MRSGDRRANRRVPRLLDGTLAQCFLQPVGEDDDPVLLAQLAPDLVGLGLRQHLVLGLREEALCGELEEVQLVVLRVAQTDGNRDGAALGQPLRETYQDGGLAGADAADQDLRPPLFALLEASLQDVAEVVAPHDMVHGQRCPHEVLRVAVRLFEVAAADPSQPPEQQRRDGQEDGDEGDEQPGDHAAGVRGLAAAPIETEQVAVGVDEAPGSDDERPEHEEHAGDREDGDQGRAAAVAVPGPGYMRPAPSGADSQATRHAAGLVRVRLLRHATGHASGVTERRAAGQARATHEREASRSPACGSSSTALTRRDQDTYLREGRRRSRRSRDWSRDALRLGVLHARGLGRPGGGVRRETSRVRQ
jgi:hypothetical protein